MRWRGAGTATTALGVAVFSTVWCVGAFAGVGTPPITFTVDENCGGSFVAANPTNPALPPVQAGTLPCGVAQDPTPGGRPTVTYDLFAPPLPPLGSQITPGDLLLIEPGDGISDVIRFLMPPAGLDGGGISAFLVFYSDNSDGVDALADVGIPPPGPFQVPPVMMLEVGPEGNNGVTYTPLPGQPGFLNNFPLGFVTYVIRSDTVPEPMTLALLGIGLVGLGFSRRARKQ